MLRSELQHGRHLGRRSVALFLTIALTALSYAADAVGTLAGSSAGFTNGAGAAAQFDFSNPAGIAVDSSGNIFVADVVNNVIRKITAEGVVNTFAGTGAAGSANGTGTTTVQFNQPRGLTIDGADNLYVADTGNNAIRKITSGAVVTTIATTGLSQPQGIAADRAGTAGAAMKLYVADTSNHAIKQIDLSGPTVSVLAGSNAGALGYINDTGTNARFRHPLGVVLSADGTILYVADDQNHAIRKVVVATGVVTTLAGADPAGGVGTAGYQEGTGNTALFRNPAGVGLGTGGNILVADALNYVIRSVTTGGVTSLVAGTAGSLGTSNGLALSAARFNVPSSVAANATAIYVVDVNNERVRAIAATVGPTIGTQPTNQTVASGATAHFIVANVTSSPPASYQWQVSSDGGTTWSNLSNGTITGGTFSGSTTADLAVATTSALLSGFKFRVVVSNGIANATSNPVTLTINQAPVITNTVTSFFVTVNQPLTAAIVTASGSPAPVFGVSGSFPSWAAFDTTTGAITGTPTDTVGSPFSFTVTATNDAGTSPAKTFTITVQTGPTITTQPADRSVQPGQSASFSVVASSTPAISGYQWQRSTDGGSTWSDLNESSTYIGTTGSTLTVVSATLAMNADRFRVVVTNSAGSSTSSAARLTVSQVPSFTSGATATFVVNQPGTFTVQAIGSPAPTFGFTGDFPSWASLDTTTGVISGTPTDTTGSPFSFTLSATNSSGTATQSFTLTVSTTPLAPQISTQPTNQTVGIGQNATFTAAATGNPAPSYRWQRFRSGDSAFADLSEGTTYTGTATAVLTVHDVTAAMGGDIFRVVATNTNGNATSNAVTLNITLGTVWATIAGKPGVQGFANGSGTTAQFVGPNAIVVDSSGNAYVTDPGNHVIRKVTSAGVVTTFAGVPGSAGTADTDLLNGVAGKLNTPSAIAMDSSGNLLVADTGNHAIRKIAPNGVISTVAGSPGVLGYVDDAGTNARFTLPSGIAVDSAGTIYVADTLNQVIRRIVGGNFVQTFAGTAGSSGAVNGTVGAKFNFPNGLAVDSSGNLYVADSRNHAIRKVTAGGEVSTFAGILGSSGSTDGNVSTARFNQPLGVAVGTDGALYVADSGNSTIRRIAASEVTTIGGVALAQGTADGSGSTARFNQPYGIAVDSSGSIWIADTFNHTIRRSGALAAPSFTTSPADQFAAVGGTATFSVAASGVPSPGFQWQRKPHDSSDFANITDGGNYSGTGTATLIVSNITADMSGDQFRAVAANQVSPNAESSPATLTVIVPPTFTSANTATFRVGEAGLFSVTVNSSRSTTFTASGLPDGLSINSSTGLISGTPTSTSGSPFSVTLTANNGTGPSTAVTQTLTLTVEPGQVVPTITTQPVGGTYNRGDTVTLTASGAGTAPLVYQWLKNGAAINGATSGTLTIPNAQVDTIGSYSVQISNAFGSATSTAVSVNVNTPPTIVQQPRSQTALAGATTQLSVGVVGGSGTTYQWRKNGVAIGGANNASLTLSNVSANDAAGYDVLVSNAQGSAVSSVAQVTVVSSATAPVFIVQPASRTVVAGGSVTLSAAAAAAPAAAYQWRRSGVAIPNATAADLTLSNVQAGDAGQYTVVASNSAGSATSGAGTLRVIARSYAGVYFGSFANNLGTFAIYVRDDNTGVFLGYLPGSTAPVLSLNVIVNDAGQFSFSQSTIAALAGDEGEPARAAALQAVALNGTINSDGTVSGSMSGGASATFTATREPTTGSTQNLTGFYQAGSSTNGTNAYTIVSATGKAFALAQSGTASDGGTGTATSNGNVVVSTSRSTITENIASSSGAISGTVGGAVNASVSGASEAVLAAQRLANISSRARVTGDTSVAIAGFVITGNESKPVLIRAVGPTLASSFSVPGALATPVLELRTSANVLLATNSGISTLATPARDAIAAAGTRAGAFALGSSGVDAAIVTTLPPGAYTAVVSGANGAAGIVLVEVYDLSGSANGQKLLNISTRANAGSGADVLTAGVVVTGSVPKRVLIRAVGPGLTQFGLSGVLTNPTLALINQANSQTVAQNTGWTNSADKDAITTLGLQVGAFPLTTGDSAMIVSLAPGNYSATVTSGTGATGVAIVEVYELP